jgi:hypothetical protein
MMSGVGYSKFFWSDWRSDPKLRMCSLAARGLWIDMLSLMAEASPKGDLRIGDAPMTIVQLATVIGSSIADVETAFAELEKVGVFSRTRAGVVYSRRIRRDENRKRISRDNGKMGGNPRLSKESGNSNWDNPQVTPMVHPVPAKEENPTKRVFSLASEPVPPGTGNGAEMTPEDEERRRLKVEAAKSRLGYDH